MQQTWWWTLPLWIKILIDHQDAQRLLTLEIIMLCSQLGTQHVGDMVKSTILVRLWWAQSLQSFGRSVYQLHVYPIIINFWSEMVNLAFLPSVWFMRFGTSGRLQTVGLHNALLLYFSRVLNSSPCACISHLGSLIGNNSCQGKMFVCHSSKSSCESGTQNTEGTGDECHQLQIWVGKLVQIQN
jgi:hypothetical protein